MTLFGWFRKRGVQAGGPIAPAKAQRRPYVRRSTRARLEGILLDAFTRGGPYLEYPGTEHRNVIDAIVAVLEQRKEWIRTRGPVTLTAQGAGLVPDGYRFASVVMGTDGIDLKCHGVDVAAVARAAGVPADACRVSADATRLVAPKPAPERLARFLDAYFRHERGIQPFPGEGEYAVGAEPGSSFLDDTEPGLAPVDVASAPVIPGTERPPADAPKKFFRSGPLRRLVDDPRACIASDRILVDGRPVGHMVRAAPSMPEESGWQLFAGDESEAYLDTAANFGVYALNSVANVDPEIVPFLWAPVGAEFRRAEGGPLRRVSSAPPRG